MRLRSLIEKTLRPLSSREVVRWARVDDGDGPYDRTFRVHRLKGDPAADPCWLWRGRTYLLPSGLHGHLREHARRRDAPLDLDLALVLHPDDLADLEDRGGGGWRDGAERYLAHAADDLALRFGWALRPPGYSFDVRILPDAHPDLRCELGLDPGTFATAIGLRTARRRPAAAPELRVFVRPPGSGLTPVGTVWTDQAEWTAGGHALDDVRLLGLPPAAIRGEREPGSSAFTFRLGGGLSSTHRLVDRRPRGSRVLVVRAVDDSRDLVRIELRSAAGEAAKRARRSADAAAIRTITPANAVRLEVPRVFGPTSGPVVLREVGVMVQRIHFGAIRCFWMGIERDGRVDPDPVDPVARLEVIEDCLGIVGVASGLVLDGELLEPGQRSTLAGAVHEVSWEGGAVRVVPTRLRGEPSWPYLARVVVPGRRLPLRRGDSYRIGRSSKVADIELPERRTPGNISWKDGLSVGPVALGAGTVERTSVVTDAIGVPGRAAELTLDDLQARLTGLSDSCPAWVVGADGGYVPLGNGASRVLQAGDRFIVGNSVFEADLPTEAASRDPDEVRTVVVGLGSDAFRRARSVQGKGFQARPAASRPRGLEVGRPTEARWRSRPPKVGALPRMMPGRRRRPADD